MKSRLRHTAAQISSPEIPRIHAWSYNLDALTDMRLTPNDTKQRHAIILQVLMNLGTLPMERMKRTLGSTLHHRRAYLQELERYLNGWLERAQASERLSR